MAIKLTKNEQKVQKDHLKQYQRYLPTLQLKKQQLQSVIMKTKAELEQKEVERAQMIGDLDDWVAVFAENEIFDEEKKLDHLVQPETVICKNENIAGVTVPTFQELTFKDIVYDVDDYPLWVDTAIVKLREIARLDALVSTLRKQETLLENELRATSQRVNLFEKVKIPEAKENILYLLTSAYTDSNQLDERWTGDDFIFDFLQISQKGYSVHFASAAVSTLAHFAAILGEVECAAGAVRHIKADGHRLFQLTEHGLGLVVDLAQVLQRSEHAVHVHISHCFCFFQNNSSSCFACDRQSSCRGCTGHPPGDRDHLYKK